MGEPVGAWNFSRDLEMFQGESRALYRMGVEPAQKGRRKVGIRKKVLVGFPVKHGPEGFRVNFWDPGALKLPLEMWEGEVVERLSCEHGGYGAVRVPNSLDSRPWSD